MKKRILPLIALLVWAAAASAQQGERRDYQFTLRFDSGKHLITTERKAQLELELAAIREYDCLHINIVGHTDSQGSVAANTALSKRRTEAAAAFLQEIGYPAGIMEQSYESELHPMIPDNEQDDLMALNRRVEITMTVEMPLPDATLSTTLPDDHPTHAEPLPEEEPMPTLPSLLPDLFAQLDQPSQTFVINADEDSQIQGEGGFVLQLDADALCECDGSGKVGGEVGISLREYHSMGDFVAGNLSTQSGRRVLRSGGTVHISATQGDKALCLREGKPARLFFPRKMNDKYGKPQKATLSMNTYLGERDGDSNINWTEQQGGQDANLLNKESLDGYNLKCGGGGGGYTKRKRTFWQRIGDFFRGDRQAVRRRNSRRGMTGLETNKDFRQMEKEYEQIKKGKKLDRISPGTVEYYVLRANQLGWLNCDDFPSYKQAQMVDIKIPMEYDQNTTFKVVIPKYNGMMQAYGNGKSYVASSIPKHLNAKLVAIRYTGGLPELAIVKFRTGSPLYQSSIKFKEHSVAELRDALANL